MTLYYEKSHPTVALNVADIFVQENEKYGLNFSLRQPLSPVRMNFEAYRHSNEGDSFTQVTNNQITHQSISAQSSFSKGGHAQLSYSKNRQESLSGTKGQPIQPFAVTTKTTDVNTRLFIGKEQKADLNMIASYTTQEQDRDLTELKFSPSLLWNHRQGFSSSYRYNLLNRKQGGVENNAQSAAIGVRYDISKTINTTADVHFEDNDATGLELESVGGQGSILYKNKFGFGELQLSAGLNYDEYNRTASAAVQVVDALYTFVGITPVTLAHDYIDTSTIEIRRADTNELLTIAVDYIVTPVGSKVEIEKINPALPADLNVLVGYEYDPGGSANYDSFAYNLQANIKLYKHFTVFMSYRDTEQTLESGVSTPVRLDSSDTTRYGLKVDYMLPTDVAFTVGGEVSYEKHNKDISSYERNNSDIYMQMDLPYSSNLHLSMRRLQVDNIFSTEDVDLTRYSARLRTSPAHRLTLSLQLSDEKDVGGSLPRRSRDLLLSGQWRIRKLLVELGGRRVLDTQGITKQDRTIFNVNLKREF